MPHSLIILIADDSPDDMFLFQQATEKTGVAFNLRFVNDGQEAMDYLIGTNEFANRDQYPMPSLIILDIKMPRMTGFDVLQWAKSRHELRITPILMLSNSDEEIDIQRAYALGANAYMVKPARVERLRDLVQVIDIYWREFSKLPDAIA